MKEQLERRLKELTIEFDTGQKMLGEMEAKEANVRSTLVRISGAIQVLKEELSKCSGDSGKPCEQPGLKPAEMVELEKKDMRNSA